MGNESDNRPPSSGLSRFFSSLRGAFSGGKADSSGYKIAGVYRDLRERLFNTDPGTIETATPGPGKIWALLMETGHPGAVATLVCIADGTVSFYFSNGGGIIGLGQHDGPRKAGAALLAEAPKFLDQAQPTKEFPLPALGNTRFYFLTLDGVFAAEMKEDDLGNNRVPMSPLFFKAHDVISQARLVDEKTRAEKH